MIKLNVSAAIPIAKEPNSALEPEFIQQNCLKEGGCRYFDSGSETLLGPCCLKLSPIHRRIIDAEVAAAEATPELAKELDLPIGDHCRGRQAPLLLLLEPLVL